MKKLLALLLIASTSLSFAADTDPIVCTETVKGSVKDVWEAFTKGEKQQQWMVAKADTDLRVGGLMRTHYSKEGQLGDANSIENLILSFDPERMYSIKIKKTPSTFPWKKAAESTWTVVYFEPVSAKETKVTVKMMGWTNDEESKTMRKFFDQGNKSTLAALKSFFEKQSR